MGLDSDLTGLAQESDLCEGLDLPKIPDQRRTVSDRDMREFFLELFHELKLAGQPSIPHILSHCPLQSSEFFVAVFPAQFLWFEHRVEFVGFETQPGKG